MTLKRFIIKFYSITRRGRRISVALSIALTLTSAIVWLKLNDRTFFEATFRGYVSTYQGEAEATLTGTERDGLLDQLLNGRSEERVRAARRLAASKDVEVVPAIIASMRDRRTYRPCQLAHALGQIGDPSALPALVEVLNHPSNTDLRTCAAIAIGDIGDKAPLNQLLDRIRDPTQSKHDQTSALFAVWDIAAPTSLEVLESLAHQHPNADIRLLAESARREIAILTKTKPTAALLNELVQDTAWVWEDWVCQQLSRCWDSDSGDQVNAFLRRRPDLHRVLLARLGALLTCSRSWESETLLVLGSSDRVEYRWLADLAVESVGLGKLSSFSEARFASHKTAPPTASPSIHP